MKIFIIAPEHIDKLNVANKVTALNDDLNICKMFTSEHNLTGIIGEYQFYMDADDIVLSFKNNALLFIDYSDEKITGITLDDYNSSDILCINTAHFNSIPDFLLAKNEILLIWLDSKEKTESFDKDVIESRYLQERIDNLNIPFMYFMNEDKEDIAKTIVDYLKGDEEKRIELLQENS